MNIIKHKIIKLGILGTGWAANKIAETIQKTSSNFSIFAVGSRNKENGQKFATQYNIPNIYNYDELLANSQINLVYIALPNNLHYEYAKKALLNNHNVLVEKPMTLSYNETKELLELAKSKNLFIIEGLWIQFLPIIHKIKTIIDSGIIGEVKHLSASLSYPIENNYRIYNVEYGGGALYDLGIYCIGFCQYILGNDIKNISVNPIIRHGVDVYDNIILEYNNAVADLTCSVFYTDKRLATISGTNGFIVLDSIGFPIKFEIYDNSYKLLDSVYTQQITGYEFELQECYNAIINKQIETKSLSHDEILANIKVMESIRNDYKKN